MGIRFSKRITLIPGVRLNIGLGGVSTSVGPRGLSLTMGKRGTFLNAGLPGTGLSYRERIGGSSRQPAQARAVGQNQYEGPVKVLVSEDGTVLLTDLNDNALPAADIRRIKSEKSDDIEALLEKAAEQRNKDLDACLGVHLLTPDPTVRPNPPAPFAVEPPVAPSRQEPSVLDKIMFRAAKVEQKADDAEAEYAQELAAWTAGKDAHEAARLEIEKSFRLAAKGFSHHMEMSLDYLLSCIAWPKQTSVEYAFSHDVTGVALDVDLPDEGDMPRTTAEARGNGKLTLKNRTDAQCRRDFVELCYGSLFRVAGEVFSLFPGIEKCLVSGYIQRPNAATGRMGDDYIISVIIDRGTWCTIDFGRLEHVDAAAAFSSLGARVAIDRSSRFKTIQPYDLEDLG